MDKLEPTHVNCAFCPAQAVRTKCSFKFLEKFILDSFQCPVGHFTYVKQGENAGTERVSD